MYHSLKRMIMNEYQTTRVHIKKHMPHSFVVFQCLALRHLISKVITGHKQIFTSVLEFKEKEINVSLHSTSVVCYLGNIIHMLMHNIYILFMGRFLALNYAINYNHYCNVFLHFLIYQIQNVHQ